MDGNEAGVRVISTCTVSPMSSLHTGIYVLTGCNIYPAIQYIYVSVGEVLIFL
jgi:hypothetical protein